MTAPAGTPAAPAAPEAPAAPAAPTPPAPADGGNNGWTPPASQDEFNRIISERLARQTRTQYGGLTAEQFAELKAKADAADAEKATDVQRAAAEAQKAAREAADAEYRPRLAETAFRVAIGEAKPQAEVDEFVADLNLTRFLKDDGSVDTAKVLARVKEFTGSGSTTAQKPPPKGPVVPGHNPGGTTPGAVGVKAGGDLYDQLHPPKKT